MRPFPFNPQRFTVFGEVLERFLFKLNNDKSRVMKKQFYIAPFSEIVEISQEGGVCLTLSEARFIGFLEDGGDL